MNSATRELLVRGLRALVRSSLWWGGGLLAFTLLNLAFWPSFEDSSALADLEESNPELLEAFGAANIGSPEGYLDGQVFALFLPLLLSAAIIAAVTALTAGDEENGRLELLHALPVSRQELWLARLGSALISLAVIVVVVLVFVVALLKPFSLDEAGYGAVILATLACGVLAVFHGAVAYLVSALRGTRAAAVGASVLVLALGYVIDFLVPLVPSIESLQKASPWYWAIGQQPVSDGLHAGWMALLVGVTAVLIAAGTVAIGRRDLRTP